MYSWKNIQLQKFVCRKDKSSFIDESETFLKLSTTMKEEIACEGDSAMSNKKEQTKTTGKAAHKKSAEYLRKGSKGSKKSR
jgi:hypothetical protein